MNLEARLDESIARWNLLESRFYQAWSAGTLPVEALRTYAAEYGAFISLIPKGWESHGVAEDDVYDQSDAGGFIRLFSLPSRIAALKQSPKAVH